MCNFFFRHKRRQSVQEERGTHQTKKTLLLFYVERREYESKAGVPINLLLSFVVLSLASSLLRVTLGARCCLASSLFLYSNRSFFSSVVRKETKFKGNTESSLLLNNGTPTPLTASQYLTSLRHCSGPLSPITPAKTTLASTTVIKRPVCGF